MRPIAKTAAATLELLAQDLLPASHPEAQARRVGEHGGPFMQVVVERLDERTVSVAHYYSQNGDAMRDPEMLFVKALDGQWYATYFRQDSVGVEQTSAEYQEATGGFLVRERIHKSHTTFANTWMRNIRAQQADYFRALAREERARAKAALAAKPPERAS